MVSAHPGTVVLPLKGGYTRKELVLDDQGLTLRFRPIFGNRTVFVPRSNVCVVLPEVSPADDSGEGWVFVEALNVATIDAMSGGPADTVLLFDRPVLLPRLSWQYFLGSTLDFKGGDAVDGMALRAREPDLALRALVAAGFPSTDTPTRWLRERRATTTDPDAIRAAAAELRRKRWSSRLFVVVLLAVAAGIWFCPWLDPDTTRPGVLAGLAVGAGGLIRQLLTRRSG